MITWPGAIAVAAGAAVGGVLRYVVGVWFAQRFGPGFPLGTLFINVTGSFLIGVVVEVTQTRALAASPMLRLLLATGLLGGYTTFAAFSYEALTLGVEGAGALSFAYAAGSVLLGVAACFLGVGTSRLMLRP